MNAIAAACHCPPLDPSLGSHMVSCPLYEPPLTAAELRQLRKLIEGAHDRAEDVARAKRTEQQIRAIVRSEFIRHIGGGFDHETSPSDGVVDNPTAGEGAPGPDIHTPGSGPGTATKTPESAAQSDTGYRPAADTPNPPESAAGQPARRPLQATDVNPNLISDVATEEFDRTDDANYIALTVTTDSITERWVRDGAVVAERQLEAIPAIWPESQAFWGAR